MGLFLVILLDLFRILILMCSSKQFLHIRLLHSTIYSWHTFMGLLFLLHSSILNYRIVLKAFLTSNFLNIYKGLLVDEEAALVSFHLKVLSDTCWNEIVINNANVYIVDC